MTAVSRLLDRLFPPPPRDHAWLGGPIVDEPGISDVDGGAWARRDIVCTHCGEARRVWRGIDVTGVERGQCPAPLRAAERTRP